MNLSGFYWPFIPHLVLLGYPQNLNWGYYGQLIRDKVHLVVAKENKKAIHIYEKIGFHIEGEMKEHFYLNGSYHDAYMMAIFQDEWTGKSLNQ
ncbi:hypothetical protein GCM10008986_07960 [Salinibacillus aidingensis]|uniref:Diamine N-acetyltransferase n=1 Tax=Salinibacillus aidingensis TaxID=237684 RepID=A0ABN1AW77_9BACI